jgi:hypothetical protein
MFPYLIVAAVLFWLGLISALRSTLILMIATAVLAMLKLAGIFEWSWWWALSPLWIVTGGIAKAHYALSDPLGR